mmetsp:Transcript_54919/g.146948  ORF Transcript_54919/g.146948 Transcript_54919/m.146948 type:complete len:638 (+) Transcript_54919:48-1961(+)
MSNKSPHPGTAAARAMAEHRVVEDSHFERRFTASAALKDQTFDFVVVGSGSAGSACAGRLAASPSRPSVLLLEAGGEAQNAPAVRAHHHMLRLWRSEVDWHYRTTPQPQLTNADNSGGRVMDLERGKTLGGSSCLNYGMWVRGAAQDFNRWANQFKCGSDWSYEAVLPNFKRLEGLAGSPLLEGGEAPDAKYRGFHGPVAARVPHPPLPEVRDFIQACAANGVPPTNDYNGAQMEGAAPTQFSVLASGGRANAFTSFVDPLVRQGLPNLTVASEAFVTKVVLEGTKAKGVQLELPEGDTITVRAGKEVILSAGAIATPQLLMLSSIGPRDQLEKYGIPVVSDLPGVGSNLQDHPVAGLSVCAPPKAVEQLSARLDSTGLNGVAFTKSRKDKERDGRAGVDSGPDLELVLLSRLDPLGWPVKAFVHDFQGKMPQLHTNSWLQPLRDLIHSAGQCLVSTVVEEKAKGTIGLMVVLNHPGKKSMGSVKLSSGDIRDHPLIDDALVRDEEDVECLLEGVKLVRDILLSPGMKKWVGGVEVNGLANSVEELAAASDEALRAHILRTTTTTWHYSCTARMGDPADPDVVCDPHLRVKGVQGLRVADASVMPFVVSGNTNASSMMIGDKCAELVLRDHGLKDSE